MHAVFYFSRTLIWCFFVKFSLSEPNRYLLQNIVLIFTTLFLAAISYLFCVCIIIQFHPIQQIITFMN